MTPDGWQRATLGGLAAGNDGLQTGPFGAQLHASDYVPDGVPVVMPKDLTGGRIITDSIARIPEHLAVELARHRVNSGDILFARRGDIGRCGLVADEEQGWLCGTGCLRARFDLGKVSSRFLAHALTWTPSVQWLTDNAVGQTMLNLNTGILAKLPVLMPSLPEQRKIAAILSSVDDAIEGTQAVIDQLQVVKKAMMAELLTRGLPGRHTRFKQTEVGEVPEEWSIRPCGELFEVQLGKMMSVQARAGASQFPYLRNENVHWLRFDLSDVATMHFEEGERAKFRLRPGDLLACEGRHIGRGVVWRGEVEECYFQKALHRLRPRSDEITTEYMQFFMMLRFRYMTDLVAEANATSTIPHLSRERLVALPVWYPPRADQDEIAAILSSLVERERSEEDGLIALANMKAALMSVLLTGEVRVTPDETT